MPAALRRRPESVRKALTLTNITASSRRRARGARFTSLLLAGSAVFALAGCATAADAEPTPAADAVTIEGAWVKTGDDGMTAAFGTLANESDADVTVVSVESDASPTLELHETLENEAGQSVMREVESGFTIPANGTLELSPAGNHIMLMELPEPVLAGDDVTFTLRFSDDSTLEFDALAKDYAGANEEYEPGEGDDMDHSDMGHDDMSHDDAAHDEHGDS
ncbi:copper chaperone PCu(A)C [Leucobacter tardus]